MFVFAGAPMGLTESTNGGAVTPIPDNPMSSSSSSSSIPSSEVSSARTRQKKKVSVVGSYRASTEEPSSEEQGFTASSGVVPPAAHGSRKSKGTTVTDEPWKELTVNLHQLVIMKC